MLVEKGNIEVGEDQQEDKDVIYTQSLLDQVAGQEFKGGLRTTPEVDSKVEEKSQGDPECSPAQASLIWTS